MTYDLDMLLDILKVVVGLVYLYLEYKARPAMWIASIIMPAIGMWLFFNKGLYADFAINIYYLVIAVYGWYVWTRKPKSAKQSDQSAETASSSTEKAPSHIPLTTAAVLAAVWLCVWGAIAWILATFTDSTVVALDSLTTSLSIAGMWMLARKYVEQWWVWFVVDGIYVWLYYYKGIYFSGTLYAFYTIMAVAGYFKWLKMMAPRGRRSCG